MVAIGDENLKKWLEFYYGTADVSPSKISGSLGTGHFSGYTRYARTKANSAMNRRVIDYARSKGVPIQTDEYRPDGFLSGEDADKVNRELSDLFGKTKEAAWATDEAGALEAGVARRGLDPTVAFTSRPALLFGGIREDVLTDGYMLLIGHGSKDILTKAAKSIKLPVGKTISEMVQESHFPDYKQLIPTPETRTAELRVVGVRYNRAGSGFQTILTDGENVIAVNADKLAWLRKRLPDAKIYGSTAYRQDELNSCAPITFVENGEAVGVLMPMFIGKDKAETWTNLPDVIKQAVRRDEKKSGRTQSVAPSIPGLQAIHDARTDRAKAADERLQHSVVIEPDDPRADVWKRDPGRMDVRGVDTPRKSKARKRKTSHRSSSSGGMQSLK